MNTNRIASFVFALLISATAFSQKEKKCCKKNKCNKKEITETTEMTLETKLDSVSYSLGVNIAENLKGQGMDDVNVDALAKGMADFLKESELLVPQAEVMSMITSYMQAKQNEKFAGAKEEGEKFLVENGKRKGVVTLPSGLQYEVIKEGDGPKPKPTDKVTTHYHGTLIDGTVFDSSVDKGQPASFPVNGVIRGWQEALVLMPEGSKWKLFIPYSLAYGERGNAPTIAPFSTLIFDIELISIN